jgi:hypothetical protein
VLTRAEKKSRTAMLGTTEVCGVEGFVQLLSGSSRRRAHGGHGEHFDE